MTTPAPAPAAGPPRPARRRPRWTVSEPSVLFDAPGPKARLRSNLYTLIALIVLLGIAYLVVRRLDQADQFEGRLWSPFLKGEVWTEFIIPGLISTMTAAAVAAVLAIIFGLVFGLGRLSEHAWIRVPSAAVVEFFRAIPLLLLIFFVFSGPAFIAGALNREFPQITAYAAVVIGLMLYNGSVLAEIFRSGIQSVPAGQSEAAYALGLRKTGVMRLVLVPQAITAMMPAIVSQLVVLLKDSALGWIIAYEDLMNAGFRQIPSVYGNLLPAAFVIALIYIAINLLLSALAHRLERRSRRSPKNAAGPVPTDTGVPPAPGMGTYTVDA